MSRTHGVVCDASTVVDLCISGAAAPAALHAPALVVNEVTAVLRRIEHGGAATHAQTDQALAHLTVLGISLVDDIELQLAALEVARTLGWARTYDALYVALAQRSGLPLMTGDGRLRRGAARLVDTLLPGQT